MTDATTTSSWKGVMVPLRDFLTERTRYVPGWECITCGAQYGSVRPPSKCWNGCEGDDNIGPM